MSVQELQGFLFPILLNVIGYQIVEVRIAEEIEGLFSEFTQSPHDAVGDRQ
jgi:hypothetical protein